MSFSWFKNKLKKDDKSKNKSDKSKNRSADADRSRRRSGNADRDEHWRSNYVAGELAAAVRPKTRKKSGDAQKSENARRKRTPSQSHPFDDWDAGASNVDMNPVRNRRDSKSESFPYGSPGHSGASPAQITKRTVIALYDYDARTDEDLSFGRGQYLEVLEKPSDDWWLARSHLTGLQGYVPANYVAYLKSIQAEDWYFGGIKRAEAERYLMLEDNDHGSFLVRKSESRTNEFSLSIRDDERIRHYRIRVQETGGGYFISRREHFANVRELINFYRRRPSGLCVRLRRPCIRDDVPDPYGLSYNTLDMWEIPREQIILKTLLGQGHFGQVFEGRWNRTVPVAVKTLKEGKMDSDEFLAEAQFLKRLRHPKLLQLYGVCTSNGPLFIITELMRNGSLLDYMRGRGRDMELEDQVYMGAQVADGMEYLEGQNYIHRDLAARNVLVGKNKIAKVADFGLSRLLKGEEYLAQEGAKFPIKWTAPEALNYNIFSTKSDVWSFGVLMMEIMTYGVVPYPGMSNAEVADKIERGYRMPQPHTCPSNMYDLILETWDKDPSKRPTFSTLKWKLEDFFTIGDSDYRDADQVA